MRNKISKDKSLLDKFEAYYIFAMLLIPCIEDILRICQIHPNIADSHGEVDDEQVVPQLGMSLQVENAWYDAEEMKYFVPEA